MKYFPHILKNINILQFEPHNEYNHDSLSHKVNFLLLYILSGICSKIHKTCFWRKIAFSSQNQFYLLLFTGPHGDIYLSLLTRLGEYRCKYRCRTPDTREIAFWDLKIHLWLLYILWKTVLYQVLGILIFSYSVTVQSHAGCMFCSSYRSLYLSSGHGASVIHPEPQRPRLWGLSGRPPGGGAELWQQRGLTLLGSARRTDAIQRFIIIITQKIDCLIIIFISLLNTQTRRK